MKSTPTTLAFFVLSAGVALAQGQAPNLPPGPDYVPASVQAPLDPGYAALTGQCKTPPPPRGARGGGGGAGGGAGRGAEGRAGGAAAAGGGRANQPQGEREYMVTEIPGVIAAGQRWKYLWQEMGNNGDGIVGTNDGNLLLAQNDNSKVVKL